MPIRAKCYLDSTHSTPPEFECYCGIYGLKSLLPIGEDDMIKPDNWRIVIRGAVDLFGKVVYCTDGYRAEYAKVHALSPLTPCLTCALYDNVLTIVDMRTEGTMLILPSISAGAVLMCPKCAPKYAKEFSQAAGSWELYPTIDVPVLFKELCDRYCEGRIMVDI